MRIPKRAKVAAGTALAAIAAASLLLAPAGATRTLNVPSRLSIGAGGYYGKVKSSDPGCVAERSVVLRQKGHGVLGRSRSSDEGRWEVAPEGLRFKGKPPFEVFAEMKPFANGAAGTIYRCSGATSKTIAINGG